VIFSHHANNKENNIHGNKSHNSILTDRSILKNDKSFINGNIQKKKNRNSKNNLIIHLMRQIQEHQREI
jgi:hypothetical protein